MKFLSLDAFRGLAAIMVVLFHSRFYSSPEPLPFVANSYLFVDFFFILSGFIMAHAYQHRLGDSVGWKRFVVLRLGRLYPLHLFMLFRWLPYILFKWFVYQQEAVGTDPFIVNNFSTFLAHLFLVQSLGVFEQAQQFSWNFPA